MSPLPAFVLIVLINPNVAEEGAYTVFADGREVSQFALTGKSADPHEIKIAVPANAERLTMERRTSLPPSVRSSAVTHKSSISFRSPSYQRRSARSLPRLLLRAYVATSTSFSAICVPRSRP